ncbi:MAG: transporter permease [Herbinix sp.]|jgi:ribose transport system permease protein|nr:transporter permease [Herbinix sp.]
MEKSKIQQIIKSNMMIIILVLLVIVFGLLSPNFLTVKNLMNICTQNAYFIVATIGVALVMISGGTDLSVGQILAVIGVSIAMLMQSAGLPVPVAIILGGVIGMALGAFNGLSANILKIHPMIVTLATMAIYKGISYTLSGSKSFFDFDESYIAIGQGYVGVVSVPIIIAIVVALIIHFMLEKTCFGRFIYAVGGNAETARLAGINVSKIKVMVFGIAGVLYTISTVILTSRGGSASSSIGPGVEFDAITACVLGGVSFIGGEGRVKDAVVGCLILGILGNGMQLIGMGVYTQNIVKGLILMASIGYDTYQKMAKVKKVVAK